MTNAERGRSDLTPDELLVIWDRVLETARANIAAIEAAEARPTLAQEVDRVWIVELGRRGIPADRVPEIRALVPAVLELRAQWDKLR
jgi:hypothetical protein